MDSRSFWEHIYSRFNPEEPANPDWRVERPYSPAGKILTDLQRPFGARRYLVYGTIGSGKTTELRWLGDQRAHNDVVVFVDLHTHFQRQVGDPEALEHLQPWEAVFLIGLAVYKAGDRLLSHRWAAEELAALKDAAGRFMSAEAAPKLDIAKLANTLASQAAAPAAVLGASAGLAPGLVIGALGVVSALSGAVGWEFPIGLPGRSPIPDQEERAQRLLHAVNRLIATLQEKFRPVTLIVDGLDRITRLDTVHELFIGSALLGGLACRSTIIAAPISLRHEGYAGQVRDFEPRPLANFPVLLQADPRQDGPGVPLCVSVWRQRTADLDPDQTRFPEPLLRRLARFSGGRMRDFVRLARMVAEYAWDRALDQVDAAIVEAVIDDRRRVVEEGLNHRHLELLQQVMDDPRHLLPADERTLELLNNLWLLPYPNESIWWFPHPLLTRKLLPLSSG